MPELTITIPDTPTKPISFFSRIGTKTYVSLAFVVGFATGVVIGRVSK